MSTYQIVKITKYEHAPRSFKSLPHTICHPPADNQICKTVVRGCEVPTLHTSKPSAPLMQDIVSIHHDRSKACPSRDSPPFCRCSSCCELRCCVHSATTHHSPYRYSPCCRYPVAIVCVCMCVCVDVCLCVFASLYLRRFLP
jgi:hypothetical protein